MKVPSTLTRYSMKFYFAGMTYIELLMLINFLNKGLAECCSDTPRDGRREG